MQKYRVIVTWEAIYDIAEIADYIEAQFGIARADRFQPISAVYYFLHYHRIRKRNPCLKGAERGT